MAKSRSGVKAFLIFLGVLGIALTTFVILDAEMFQILIKR